MKTSIDELFGPRRSFPDPDASEQLERLIGLDDHKSSLSKFLGAAINPDGLTRWIARHHPQAGDALSILLRRPPLAILAGDVGSGKTALAESVGDAVARTERLPVTLYPMSLSTRGQGRVGEMTQLLSQAFDLVYSEARKLRREQGPPGGGVILLIDEADALAQSREEAQMHHEDRAGVNTFIRGIDRLSELRLPVAALMCTNRLTALDPAIRRRAGEVLIFGRPDADQRLSLMQPLLEKLGFSVDEIEALVVATGANEERSLGFTYSDITQRLIPGIVMRSYPHKGVDASDAISFANSLVPTPPFSDGH